MNNKLTQLETLLLKAMVAQHKDYFSTGCGFVDNLRVIRRDVTGVGCYVIFEKILQSKAGDELQPAELGFNGVIAVPDVPSGLGAVVCVENGVVNYIELFTYGSEKWSGNTTFGTVEPSRA